MYDKTIIGLEEFSELTFKEKLSVYTKVANEYFKTAIEEDEKATKVLTESMKYSLLAGGKRLRPALVMECYKIASGNNDIPNKVLAYAASLEFIHTYSLIHDDLPCMDDDDMRRGIPTNHTIFGEAVALLAGDALLTEAFNLIAEKGIEGPHDYEPAVKAVRILSKCAGYRGMCGGQEIDLKFETATKEPEEELILKMYELKTGCLFSAACALGCIAAKRYDLVPEATEFGRNLGIAFQITDDILDVTGNAEEIGKPVGSDEENNKKTYISKVGIEKAKQVANESLTKAKEAVSRFKNNSFLVELCDEILERRR